MTRRDELPAAERLALAAFWAAVDRLAPYGYWAGLLTPEDVLQVDPALARMEAGAIVRDHESDWEAYLLHGEYARDLIADVLANPTFCRPGGPDDVDAG